MKTVRGKYLVRRSKAHDGGEKIIICGVFNPVDFDIASINPGDEMWVSDLLILPGGIRFSGRVDGALSPEDFLEGEFQMPSAWTNKESL